MKKTILFTGILGIMALSSCVSLSEHESLQAKYDQTAKQYKLTLQERDELRESNANLTKTNNALTSDFSALSAEKQQCEGTVDSYIELRAFFNAVNALFFKIYINIQIAEHTDIF